MDHDLEGNRGRATYSKVQDNSAFWEWSGEDRRCKLSDTASLLASRLRGRWESERTIDARHGRSRSWERSEDAARRPLRRDHATAGDGSLCDPRRRQRHGVDPRWGRTGCVLAGPVATAN